VHAAVAPDARRLCVVFDDEAAASVVVLLLLLDRQQDFVECGGPAVGSTAFALASNMAHWA
jgi:hypothetical protein